MKNIILSTLIFVFALNAQADENRTPVRFKHNDHKMSYETGFQTTTSRYQKMTNYQGKIYSLEYRKETYSTANYYDEDFYVRLREYNVGENQLETKYTPNAQSKAQNIFSGATHTAFFGYEDYLWFFGNPSSTLQIYRYHIADNTMIILDTDIPGNTYSASCVMDDCIYAFRRDNGVMVDVFKFDEESQSLFIDSSFKMESNNVTVTSAECFKDADGVLKVVYTTMTSDLGEAKFYNPATGHVFGFFSKEDLNDIRIASGSIKGDGESQAFDAGTSTADNPNRWSVWFVKNDKEKHKGEVYNKRCPIGFVQFVYENENFTRLTSDECRVVLPSDDYYSKSETDARIDITYNYMALDKSNYISNLDEMAMQKQIVLINADKKEETNFSYFDSDIYRVQPGSAIPSTDFADETYEGINVKDFWTLVGITEGAPPAPIDWELWDGHHNTNVEPSELELEFSSEGLISVESTTENSYASGFSIEGETELPIIPKLELTGGYSNKHSQTNESINELSHSNTYTFSQTIGLNETSQENAYYFYLKPAINRYHFQMYPWWDSDGTLPILGVDDYMFKVISNTFSAESFPISEGIHQIENPNDENMADWAERCDTDDPNSLINMANHNNLAPVSLSWNAYQGEASQKLTSETTNIQKQEYTYENEVEYEVGFKIPKILEFSYENSHTFKFGIGTEVESKLESSISINYNVGNPEVGFMCDKLLLNTYLFTPSGTTDWWYYDSLPNGFKPWYIAYGISTVSKYNLELLYPATNQQFIVGQDLSLKWTDGFSNAKVYILKYQDIRPENILRKAEVNRSNQTSISDLEPGKYYWAVQTTDPDGIVVWSEARPFEVLEEDFFKNTQSASSTPNMAINVYPNPTSNQYTFASFEIEEEGMVYFKLFNLQGQLVWEDSKSYSNTGIYREEISLSKLQRNGILMIQTTNSKGVRKILKY